MHFEDLWCRVEGTTRGVDLVNSLEQLKRRVEGVSVTSTEFIDSEWIGGVLLNLASIARDKDINVFQALLDAEAAFLAESEGEDADDLS